MSLLIAILYPDPNVADKVMETVEKLVNEGHLDLADSCVVVKDENGKIQLHQENNLSVMGAISGLALGTFLGWFVWLPYLGIPGAVLGALAGRFSDRGISDEEMRDLGHEMPEKTSALFLLLRDPNAETVLADLAPYGGRIFHTSLDRAHELALEEKLQQLRNQKGLSPDRSPELHD